MLARLTDHPFDDKDWIYELKLDGYRAVAECRKNVVRLYSRNGVDFKNDYPHLYSALKELNINAVLDGEIVALDPNNKTNFQMLQMYKMDPSVPVVYYVFDVMEVNGKSVRLKPLIERKEILKNLIKFNSLIRYSDHIHEKGKDFFKLIQENDLEGIMAKKADSIYKDGYRTANWLKIKNNFQQEAIIIGYTAPKGARNHFGSLILGVNINNQLIHVGNVGTGFNEASLKDLYAKMQKLVTDKSPLNKKTDVGTNPTWLKPVLVANIKFSEWTKDNHMRHPVFMGLRIDKSAKEVVKEQA